MYGNIIIGVVGPPYPYCSLVAFGAFAWLRHCAFGAFGAFGASCCAFAWLRLCAFGAFGAKSFRKKKKNNEKIKLP